MKRAGRGALHGVAAGHRARERDEVDARDRGDQVGVLVRGCSTWNTPSGSPAASRHSREALGAQRRLRGVLEDHRVAGHERRHTLFTAMRYG